MVGEILAALAFILAACLSLRLSAYCEAHGAHVKLVEIKTAGKASAARNLQSVWLTGRFTIGCALPKAATISDKRGSPMPHNLTCFWCGLEPIGMLMLHQAVTCQWRLHQVASVTP